MLIAKNLNASRLSEHPPVRGKSVGDAVSYIQRIGCQPEKAHGGQSRSWSAEQGKSGNAIHPPPPTLLVINTNINRREKKMKHVRCNVFWLLSLFRYRQFISLHVAVAENVRREDMPHLPGKRILGSSIDPAFAEARGLALQVTD